MNEWQTKQARYKTDEIYTGAKSGIFNPTKDAEGILGNITRGEGFLYLFRRLGYPSSGWDGHKAFFGYDLTTPMEGVILTASANSLPNLHFGYLLREDIEALCAQQVQERRRGITTEKAIESAPTDSILARTHKSLLATLSDLKRPVAIRDTFIDIHGRRVPDSEVRDAVSQSDMAGLGVVTDVYKDSDLWFDFCEQLEEFGDGDIIKGIEVVRRRLRTK